MAQQQPAAPPAPPAVQPPQHFWEHWCTAHDLIFEMYKRGPRYQYEDIVAHTWLDICGVYFYPFETPGSGGVRWNIRREAYRGLPPKKLSEVKPDIVTIRVTHAQPGQASSDRHYRDYLWVECKKATYDNPHGWKDVLHESIDRLAIAHANRMVFLIIAVGYKCMWFVWDPLNQLPAQPAQPQLFITRADGTGNWLIDARIKPAQPTAWINATTGEIVCGNAMELECRTTVQIGGQNVLQNINNLTMLENFLNGVRNATLQGLNPPTF
ncbi:hypothetical protein yc1106_01799 [Curvularia clavata]|uniref:Uncharacterized protein n=1 Tax=Curvularia clavata TaxID=95742 RepID=A0A9Q8Z3L4_CURCL|nr:hypothetical protein yc1106_01799 [Curvularia clavata]